MSIFRRLKNIRVAFGTNAKSSKSPDGGDDKPPSKDGFTSYMEHLDTFRKPSLLPGEKILCDADDVVLDTVYSSDNSGQTGRLFVTNFRISFHPNRVSELQYEPQPRQRSKLVGNDDIVLNSIAAIYKVSKKKRKRLRSMSSLSSSVKRIEIYCKNFRVYRFTFTSAGSYQTPLIIGNILRHAFLCRIEDMFVFDYQVKNDELNQDDIPRYNSVSDWKGLLERWNVTGFSVVQYNSAFEFSDSLPECFVVPDSMSLHLKAITRQFADSRAPIWCYTHKSGASVIRMGCCLPDLLEDLEVKVLEHIKQSHPLHTAPVVIDLIVKIASLLEISTSFEGLSDLCMPASLKSFWSSDAVFNSLLESCGWLRIVSNCLSVATEAVQLMTGLEACTVVLKEESSTDLCPLVSCLIQLMLDEESRTLVGFQCLVEREWVALGHRFSDRYCLSSDSPNTSVQQCPVFLLFLDCVHQLLLQFPSSFQFTEIYITTIWDSVCLGLFRNFLFNNLHAARCIPRRHSAPYAVQSGEIVPVVISTYAANSRPARLASVWDWSRQFAEDQMALFYNPLYIISREHSLVSNGLSGTDTMLRRDVKNSGHRSNHEKGNLSSPGANLKGITNDVEVDINVRPTSLEQQSFEAAAPTIVIEGDTYSNLSESNLKLEPLDGNESRSDQSSSDVGLLDNVSSESTNQLQRSDTFNLCSSLPTTLASSPLCAQFSIPALSLWSLCFLRWLTPATIFEGGAACEYLIQCLIVEEILTLERAITAHKDSGRRRCERRKSMLIFSPAATDDPDSSLVSRTSNDSFLTGGGGGVTSPVNSGCVTSSFPFAVASPSRVTDRSPVGGNYIDEYFKNSLIHSVSDTTSMLYDDDDDDNDE